MNRFFRMVMGLAFAVIAVGMALAAAPIFSPAPEPPAARENALDFIVDWPTLIGKRVIVVGGKVVLAREDFAELQAPGGIIMLRPPWVDREDLRYLFTHCASVMTGADCELLVSGVVARSNIGGPGLFDVDFLIQR